MLVWLLSVAVSASLAAPLGLARSESDSEAAVIARAGFDCLEEPHSNKVHFVGDRAYRQFDTRGDRLPLDTLYDAREGTFWNQHFPINFEHAPVILGTGPDNGQRGCWLGGLIVGSNDLNATAAETHSSLGIKFEAKNFTIDGVRIHNVGDGIRMAGHHRQTGGATNFIIRNVWMSEIRDDCIENDPMFSGLIEDTLMDGCYRGFSARKNCLGDQGSCEPPGPDHVWTLRRTLMRLRPTPAPRKGADPGTTYFFKFRDYSPRLVLEDNIWLVEKLGENNAAPSFEGVQIDSCSGNTIVWLGGGPYPADVPDCVTVVSDFSIWERARTDWIARHPQVRRLPVSSLKDQLLGHWRLDEGSANEDEGDGLVATVRNRASARNNVGYKFDARVYRGRWDPNGRTGGALALDGRSAFAEVPIKATAGLAEFSISFWFRTRDPNTGRRPWSAPAMVGLDRAGQGARDLGISLRGGLLSYWQGLKIDDTEYYTYKDRLVNDGHWHHVVLTSNGVKTLLYLDGALLPGSARRVNQGLVTTHALYIGASNDVFIDGDFEAANHFKGEIDELWIYETPLAPTEIAALFTLDPIAAAARVHYRFDDASGSVAHDTSGRGNHAALRGGPWSADGLLQGALELDGTSTYLEIPPEKTSGLRRFSLTFWIRTDEDGGDSVEPASNPTLLGASELGISTRSGFIGYWQRLGAPEVEQAFVASTPLARINDGHWHHVGLGNDGSETRLYVDGKFIRGSERPSGLPLGSLESLLLGAKSEGGVAVQHHAGSVDDLRLYGRALGVEEFRTLATRGLRAHFKLDETGGSTARDLSDRALDASVRGGRFGMPGKSGPSLQLNGTSDYLELPGASVAGLAAFTFSFWIKTTEDGSTEDEHANHNPALMGMRTPGDASGDFGIFTSAGKLGYWTGLGTRDRHHLSKRIVNDDRFHHVVVTNDGLETKLYLDGVALGGPLPSGKGLNVHQTIYFGAIHVRGPERFHRGSFDEIRIYDRGLSAAEVQEL